MVAADLAVERADQQPVGPQQPDQQPAVTVVPHAVTSGRTRARQRSRSPRVPRTTPRPRRAAPGPRARSARERRDVLPDQVSQPTLHAVADHGVAHRLADDEPDPGPAAPSPGRPRARWTTSVRLPARRPTRTVVPEGRAVGETVIRRQHDAGLGGGPRLRPRGSCGPCGDGRKDRAAGAGAHPQTEAVHLVTATVVRLERTLAHELLSAGRARGQGRRHGRGPRCRAFRLAPPTHDMTR